MQSHDVTTDSQFSKVTCEKLKAFLEIKLQNFTKELKKLKRKYIIIKSAHGSIIVITIIFGSLVAGLSSVIPPFAISIIGPVGSISAAKSVKFDLSKKKVQLQNALNKHSKVKNKLEFVIATNGNLTKEEYDEIFSTFAEF